MENHGRAPGPGERAEATWDYNVFGFSGDFKILHSVSTPSPAPSKSILNIKRKDALGLHSVLDW